MELDQLTKRLESAVGFRASLSSAQSGWKTAALYNWDGVLNECAIDVTRDPYLILHAGGAPVCSVNIEGHRVNRLSSPGQMTFVPPGTPVRCRFNGKVVSFSVHFSGSQLETEPYRLLNRLQPNCGFRDDLLAASVQALVKEVIDPCQHGALYADTIAEGMMLHLLRIVSNASDTRAQTLTARTLRMVIEAMDASIESGISLGELASVAGVSRGHFAKAFNESTGIPAHTYLTQQRILRARELLATDTSISDIALRCGFSSQAHFTVCFRKHTGQTPRAYRRSVS